MTVPQDQDVRLFARAAAARLADARLLLVGGRPHGAIYLAGYAIECGLKSLLIERTPAGQRPATLASFRGVAAHDFDWLRRRLAERGVALPGDVAEAMITVREWGVGMRYRPEEGNSAEAERFLRQTSIILTWTQRST